MPGGRPTKYNKTMVKKMLKFFSTDPFREVEVVHKNKSGEEWSTFEERANVLPTFSGFCGLIEVDRDTLFAWCKAHKEFSLAYKRCKELQETFLVTNTLKGLFEQPFAIFTAKNILKWTDKQDIDIKSDGKALTVAGFVVEAPKDANNNSNTKTNN
jgi:hypothetical protein